MKPVIKLSVVLFLASTLAITNTSCKKDKASNSGGGTDTAFVSFIKLADFIPAGFQASSMDYHAGTKNLYFYIHKSGTTGYSVIQLNTETKQALIVYNFNDSKWNSNNGSEGRRIRVVGNDLYVMGGANNTDFHKLSGIGNNTLTLAKVIKMPAYAAGTYDYWGESYDVAVADKLYVITMRSKITYGNLTDLSSPGSFKLGISGHGASIIYASKDGTGYLVSTGGYDGKIEVRNPVNGNFLRAVTINDSRNTSSLAKDSKDRIYFIDINKVLRYSADLLIKEEFRVSNNTTYQQFTLAEEKDGVKLYEISGSEIKTMRIPL
jgi:hypothetical protein